jgi:hypothetical protein
LIGLASHPALGFSCRFLIFSRVPNGLLDVQALFIDFTELLASDMRVSWCPTSTRFWQMWVVGEGSSMKLAGLLMLVAGWLLIVATIVLLGAAPLRGAFVAAGAAVEILGLVLVVRSHLVLRGEHG